MPQLGPLTVSAQGFGCMGLSHTYGAADEAASIATIHRAIDLGITLIDTADVYGDGHNETLVGRAIAGRRDRIVLATKFGQVPAPLRAQSGRGIDGSPAYVAAACDASLKRLGVEAIDLYYLHRVDPATPIEATIDAMARLVAAGKIRAIGVSEVSAATLRRAAAIHPIAAVQNELSLWTRDYEAELLPYCRDHHIGFVAYSPLGRGFLAGVEAIAPDDRRHAHPRFRPDALAANRARRATIEAVAARLGVTVGQVALAWVLAKGAVPIPGTRTIAHLEQNLAAGAIALDPATIAELETAFPPGTTTGDRYPAEAMARVNA
jgi:aryl-alcohol dehydrogenase-like predicted oxidoreductase